MGGGTFFTVYTSIFLLVRVSQKRSSVKEDEPSNAYLVCLFVIHLLCCLVDAFDL